MRNSGVDLVCLLVDGIPTFDSESFELELNGIPRGVAPLARVYVQNPLKGFWRSGLQPHVHHERTTLNRSFYYFCNDGVPLTCSSKDLNVI